MILSILSSSNSTRVSSKGTSAGSIPVRIFWLLGLSLPRRLYIVEERHETVVHVQLLVAVDVGVIRINGPIDAAPLAKAGECRRQLSATDDSLLPQTRLPAL